MENKNNLEKRMYFLVLYSLSGIQKGIQAGHAAIEYQLKFGDTGLYKDWAENWKTFMVMNGGTTNDGEFGVYFQEPTIGSIQQHSIALEENKIDFAIFREPDLNNAVTAVALIADERVFNHKDWPFFDTYAKDKMEHIEWLKIFANGTMTIEDIKSSLPELWNEWTEFLGGEQNAFLKTFLKSFRFA